MTQDIPATCDGCGNKLSIEYPLICLKEGLVLAQHEKSEKELGSLGSRAPTTSSISYEPQINSMTVQG